jgi:hypothetical protein
MLITPHPDGSVSVPLRGSFVKVDPKEVGKALVDLLEEIAQLELRVVALEKKLPEKK